MLGLRFRTVPTTCADGLARYAFGDGRLWIARRGRPETRARKTTAICAGVGPVAQSSAVERKVYAFRRDVQAA